MNFSIPSIDYMLEQAKATARRFPAAILFGLLSCATAIHLVHHGQNDVSRQLMVSMLGIPLSMGASLFWEGRKTLSSKLLASLAPVGLMALLFFYFQKLPDQGVYFVFAQLSLAFHLLVAFAYSWGDKDRERFWQFNRVLFLRFIACVVFTNTLFVGALISFGTLQILFKIPIPGELYGDIWFALIFVFNTLFFAAGIPRRESLEELRGSYPRLLKLFGQYVLAPLLVIYGLILYSYLVWILAKWDVPRGQVAGLVSGFSIVGILTLLLLDPIAQQEDQRWIRRFSRGFYVGILPLLVLMTVALYQRIQPYGVTENRYILSLLCGWLFCLALYLRFSREGRIQWVPISLAALALFTTFGPFSVRSVSARSQLNRLLILLEGQGLLDKSRLFIKAKETIPQQQAKEITNLFDYLMTRHGTQILKPHLPEEVKVENITPSGKLVRRSQLETQALMKALGYPYVLSTYAHGESSHYTFFRREINEMIPPLDIQGYDHALLDLRVPYTPLSSKDKEPSWRLQFSPMNNSVVSLHNGTTEIWNMNLVDLARHHQEEELQGKVSPHDFIVWREETKTARVLLVLSYLEGDLSESNPRIQSLSGHLFWSEKK